MVLVQVRFAQVVAVVQDEFFAGFQQQLLVEYPLTTKDQELVLQTGPDMAPRTSELWRMHDETEQWLLTLATGFVSLETAAYPGKDVFFARLRTVLDAVQARIRPPRVDRLGVRYVCRIDDENDLTRLGELVRPEVLGVCALAEDAPELAISQAQFALEAATLTARWGVLAPNTVMDPTMRPIDRRSWLLDIDVFDEIKRPFDAESLVEEALAHSRSQYRFFRWAIEPAFLASFGADPALVGALEDQ